MKTRKRKYKCPHCDKIVTRISNKKWITSMCMDMGFRNTRLILIKK